MSSSAASRPAARHPHLAPTFVETAFDSIFNPGVGRGTFGVLNGILTALLLSIGGMWLLGLGGQHVYVLLFLTVGLLASINWFSQTLIENKSAADEADEHDSKKQKRSSKQQSKGSARAETADDDEEEAADSDDEPPARRTRSRSRAADEERLAAAKQTRSSASNKHKGATDTATNTTAGSKKGSKAKM